MIASNTWWFLCRFPFLPHPSFASALLPSFHPSLLPLFPPSPLPLFPPSPLPSFPPSLLPFFPSSPLPFPPSLYPRCAVRAHRHQRMPPDALRCHWALPLCPPCLQMQGRVIDLPLPTASGPGSSTRFARPIDLPGLTRLTDFVLTIAFPAPSRGGAAAPACACPRPPGQSSRDGTAPPGSGTWVWRSLQACRARA